MPPSRLGAAPAFGGAGANQVALQRFDTVAPALPRLPVELPAKGHSSLSEAQFGSLRAKFPGVDIQEMETQFVEWNAGNGTVPENYRCRALWVHQA